MNKTILFIGAHPDDVEIGAAGLLIKSLQKGVTCHVRVLSNCEEQPGNEDIIEEFEKSMKILEPTSFLRYELPDTNLPSKSNEIRFILEILKKNCKPDLIVTHSLKTLHQDHLTVVENCRRIFRYSSILCYEDLKSTPVFTPKAYVSLNEAELGKKLKALNVYNSQKKKASFNMENIKVLAKKRGIDMGVKYAEAFEVIRLFL